ncbi:MAG: hypothetical protein IKX84_04730, partial [Clostridia bacterium]|nr:hypothetical protein [Clostridia bacterium]
MRKTIAFMLALLLALSLAQSAVAGAAHTHSWRELSRVEPTCTQPGRVVYVCSCGEREVKTLPALGHEYSRQVYVSHADCTHYGVFYWECERCGARSANGNDKPLGHDWGEWQVTVPAAPGKAGVEERVCARCGEKETRALAYGGEDVAEPNPMANGTDASEFLGKLRDDPPKPKDTEPLRIAMQPVGGYITYAYNEFLNLFVRAEGGVEPYTYEWCEYYSWMAYLGMYDDMPRVGKNQSMLTVFESGKSYCCIVTDAVGDWVVSRPAAVNSEFAIAEQPQNMNINGRDSVTFRCRAVGGVPFYDSGYMYAWYKADGTFVELTDGEVTVTEQGEYYCVAEDSEGNRLTSETCKAYIGPRLDLSLVKNTVSLAKGEPYTAVARITGGTGPYTGVWQLGDKVYATEVNGMAVSALIKGTEDEEAEYNCTVTDAMGETMQITLYSKKIFVAEQPEGGELPGDGNPFQLHIVIFGSSAIPFTYTLVKEGVEQQSEQSDSKSFTFPVTEPGVYTIRVKDNEGNETESNPAQVTGKIRIVSATRKTSIPYLGQSAELEVEAEGGAEPYTYKWEKWGRDADFEAQYPEYTMKTDPVEGEANVFTVTEPFTYWKCTVTDKNGDSACILDLGVGLADPKLLIIEQPQDTELDYSAQNDPSAWLVCRAARNPGQRLSFTWQFKGESGWLDVGENESLKVGGEKSKNETLGIYRCKVTDETTGRFEYSREAVVSAKFIFTKATQIGSTGRLEFEVVGGTGPYKVLVQQRYYKEDTNERHLAWHVTVGDVLVEAP